MTKDCSIVSVTVTYNGAHGLPKHLDALLRQSRPLEEIIVVDNGSEDSTVETIRNQFPQVIVLEMGKNLGVGGALAAGLSYAALEKKHDWVWLLDQDSAPADEALEQLLCGYVLSEQQRKAAAVLACLPTHGESGLSYPGLLWRDRLVLPPAEVLQQPIWFVDAAISSGTMIRRDVVEAAGLPRTDFFIDLVDFEYCLRIRRQGYQIAIVRDSVLHHTLGTPRTFEFLGHKKAWSDHASWREYYISRNHTYLVWHLYPNLRSKLFMLLRLVRHGAAMVLFSKHGLASIRMMLRGFWDGRRGRLGIRFTDRSPERTQTNTRSASSSESSA